MMDVREATVFHKTEPRKAAKLILVFAMSIDELAIKE